MRKKTYIFTAILALMVSTGAWANTPTNEEAANGTAHPVYEVAPIEGEASEGIAGVTYVNRVANRAGAAATAAENHAAHASKSAYDAATAASNAQASADIAAAVINNLQAGDGIAVEDVKSADGKSVVGKKVSANLSAGDNVTINKGTNDTLVISAVAGDTILDATNNHVLGNVNAGTAITVTPTTSGGEITEIEISANIPELNDATKPGVMYSPVNAAEVEQVIAALGRDHPGYDSDIFGGDYSVFRPIAVNYAYLMQAGNTGELSGAYSEVEDVPQIIPANYTELKARPLSAFAFYEGQVKENEAQREISNDYYARIPYDNTGTDKVHAVGDVARPVYVMDKETNGVHTGEVAPIQSVAIPVDADNFEDATTTAKIWIQK